MKRRFSNIFSVKKRRKGYKLLVGIILILIMSTLFISCNKNINSLPDNSIDSSPETVKIDNTESGELWDLPAKDHELAKRMALRKFGADMPTIEYASEKMAIIADYWGIAVYDIKNEKLCRVVDLISIGMSATQGDEYRDILVNKEGTHIIIKRAFKNPENSVPNYLYDIEKNKLEVTENEGFEKYADNMFSTNDDEVKNSLKGVDLGSFHYNIAKTGINKWLALKYSDTAGSGFSDMRQLKIHVFDDGKAIAKQVFKEFNDLPPWPTESEIIKNHMDFMKDGKVYEQSIGFEGLSEEEVMQKFKKGVDWKYIETDEKVEKYMKKINGYDVIIGISTTTDNLKNETYLQVRVY
jgi:hypothetical protein